MSDLLANTKRLLHLADEVCEERASADDLFQLDAILFADNASRRRYLDYCRMHTALALQLRAQCATERLCRHIDLGIVTIGPEPTSCGAIPLPSVVLDSPTPTFLSTALHAALGFFPEGMPLAYLIATIVTGLGILIMSLFHVSRPEQLATHSVPPAAERQLATEPLPASVGRITGMVDCKIGDSRVSLGQKIDLASGLLEITYDTGAKVILQGPVTYEVESNGGFLSVGKLTGKLEKKVASGQWLVASRSEILAPSP